jgi:hypothetical protein
MKGRIFMNRRIIDVELTLIGEEDTLVFHIDDSVPNEYIINLNSSTSQTELKLVFTKLLEILIKEDFELALKIAEGYSKGLFIDVCTEYINDLNKEIDQVKENITHELSE